MEVRRYPGGARLRPVAIVLPVARSAGWHRLLGNHDPSGVRFWCVGTSSYDGMTDWAEDRCLGIGSGGRVGHCGIELARAFSFGVFLLTSRSNRMMCHCLTAEYSRKAVARNRKTQAESAPKRG